VKVVKSMVTIQEIACEGIDRIEVSSHESRAWIRLEDGDTLAPFTTAQELRNLAAACNEAAAILEPEDA